jgi:hypothetical protein
MTAVPRNPKDTAREQAHIVTFRVMQDMQTRTGRVLPQAHRRVHDRGELKFASARVKGFSLCRPRTVPKPPAN